MKTTTQVLCISMFVTAATPFTLFSSEMEENYEKLSFTNKLIGLTLGDASDEFDIGDGPHTIIPEQFAFIFTTNSGKKGLVELAPCKFKNILGMQLAYSAFEGDEKNCKQLLKANADPHWKSKNDKTPLQIAQTKCHETIVKLLVSYK